MWLGLTFNLLYLNISFSENTVDPDQMASEAIWSGSTLLPTVIKNTSLGLERLEITG